MGTLFAYFFGALIPPNDDIPALIADKNWLIIYVYFPVTLYLLILFSFLFVFTNDSVKFLIVNNDKKKALKAVKEVYKKAKTPEQVELYYNYLKQNSSKGGGDNTFFDAVGNP